MEYGLFVCLVLAISDGIPLKHGPRPNKYNIKSLRKHMFNDDPVILGIPKDIEDLPRAPPVHPGHTLLRPTLQMLKSQVSFPHEESYDVYGNTNNIGLRNRNNEYVLYTDFRKGNNMVDNLLRSVFKAIKKVDTEELGRPYSEFMVLLKKRRSPSRYGTKTSPKVLRRAEDGQDAKDGKGGKGGKGDNGAEGGEGGGGTGGGKGGGSTGGKGAKDDKGGEGGTGAKDEKDRNESEGGESSSEEDDAYDRNPGNPFTVKRGRYLQNWPWKLDMDGDHININPYAPAWDTMGTSGADLFFARKWWYFNQDDYVPF